MTSTHFIGPLVQKFKFFIPKNWFGFEFWTAGSNGANGSSSLAALFVLLRCGKLKSMGTASNCRQCEQKFVKMEVDCVDFRLLDSNSLWELFERRSGNGGAVAYAVLSMAKKIGCLCGCSLGKSKDSRSKQVEHWKQFCENTCNLMWAKRFAFSIVSSRASYRGRLTAIWSSEPGKLMQQRVIPNRVGCVNNDIARIASLAVYSRSAEFIDQEIGRASCRERV